MARISGVNIPLNKRVEIGLTYIYGIGRSTSNKLLAEVGIEPDRKVRDLTEDDVIKLRERIDSELTVEGDLRRERSQNVKRMQVAGKKKAAKKYCPHRDAPSGAAGGFARTSPSARLTSRPRSTTRSCR